MKLSLELFFVSSGVLRLRPEDGANQDAETLDELEELTTSEGGVNIS